MLHTTWQFSCSFSFLLHGWSKQLLFFSFKFFFSLLSRLEEAKIAALFTDALWLRIQNLYNVCIAVWFRCACAGSDEADYFSLSKSLDMVSDVPVTGV